MRFDKKVKFIWSGGEAVYDPKTSQLIPADEIVVERFCHVSDLASTSVTELFGRTSDRYLLFITYGKIDERPDYVEYDDDRLAVERFRKLQGKFTVIAKEVRK